MDSRLAALFILFEGPPWFFSFLRRFCPSPLVVCAEAAGVEAKSAGAAVVGSVGAGAEGADVDGALAVITTA